MVKYCSHCGKEINGNDVCLNCGRFIKKEVEKKEPNYGKTGLILGLCSFIAWILPLFGYPVTILAIIYSKKGLKQKDTEEAKLGLLFGIIFLILTLVNSILGILMTV